MMLGRINYICFLAVACFFVISCQHSDPVEPVEPVDRTVLIYMAGDNSLNEYVSMNLKDIKEGMADVEGRVVLYVDGRNALPCLMTLKRVGNECVVDTLKLYTEEDSASPEVLARVAKEVREMYPAESYGLILWSHATGWLPQNAFFPYATYARRASDVFIPTKTFGQDILRGNGQSGYSEIELADLVEALPGGYRFILFDACFMASIEVFYELRNKADYIIASPAEVVGDGFPYTAIMPLLFGEEEQLKQICREYRDFYANHPSGGGWRSGTVAMVKCSELDAIAVSSREILRRRKSEAGKLNAADVWRYPLINFSQNVFFDFREYIRKMATDSQYSAFKKQWDEAFYYLATPNFNNTLLPTDKFSGVSTYIPLDKWSSMNNRYATFDWYKFVYGE